MKNKMFLLALSAWSTITFSSDSSSKEKSPWVSSSVELRLPLETIDKVMKYVLTELSPKKPGKNPVLRIVRTDSTKHIPPQPSDITLPDDRKGESTIKFIVSRIDACLKSTDREGRPQEFSTPVPWSLVYNRND